MGRNTHAVGYLTPIFYIYGPGFIHSVLYWAAVVVELKHLTYTYFASRILFKIPFVLKNSAGGFRKLQGSASRGWRSLRDIGGLADTKSERKSCTMSAAAMLVISA
jgi:hypothetical protein